MADTGSGPEPRRPLQTVRIQKAIAAAFIAIFVVAGVIFGLEHQWVLMALFLAAAVANGVVAGRSLLGRPRRFRR